MACDILKAGIDMIILSVGALADGRLMERINQAGSESGAKLHASGHHGFDLMRAVLFGRLGDARNTYHKRSSFSEWSSIYLDGERVAGTSGTIGL